MEPCVGRGTRSNPIHREQTKKIKHGDKIMKEKKLTDKEIIKALECCTVDEVTDCENCPLLRESCAIIRKYALDLIHRLQAENKGLEDLCNKTYDDLTKEIERLTEENYKLEVIVDHNCDPFPKWQEATIEEIAELQKQVDELKERAKIDLENERNWGKLQTKQAVKDTAKKYHNAVKELFNKWDCCGCVEDRSAEEWHEDNNKIAREQFGVEVD